jgi:hypothetical protein
MHALKSRSSDGKVKDLLMADQADQSTLLRVCSMLMTLLTAGSISLMMKFVVELHPTMFFFIWHFKPGMLSIIPDNKFAVR